MMKARLTVATGWGATMVTIVADTYKELTEKVDNFIAQYHDKDFVKCGFKGHYLVQQIKYSYPSGKTFTKNF